MRFAYADPPYLGCCRLYGHYHEAPYGCWDDPETHRQLIDWLTDEFPDGWAKSGISTTLRDILPLCPPDVRIGAWCKTFAAFKKGVRPAYHWEPIIFWRGRNPSSGFAHPPPPKDGMQTTPKDYCEVNDDELIGILSPITMKKGLTGAKPVKVCGWVLDLLNVQAGDEVVDVFPGTGVMGRVAAERTKVDDESAA